MDEKSGRTPPQITPAREQSPWTLAGLGVQFFVGIMFFVVLGNWVDKRVGSAPLFLLSGLFLGGGGTFYASYRRLMSRSRSASSAVQAPERSSDVGPSL